MQWNVDAATALMNAGSSKPSSTSTGASVLMRMRHSS
jgi:hypothetical protein